MRKYILITLATITLASCLDENPRDCLTEEEAFKTSTDLYLNTVANLYNYIGGHEDGQGLQGTTRGIYDLNTFTSTPSILAPPQSATRGTTSTRSSCFATVRSTTCRNTAT